MSKGKNSKAKPSPAEENISEGISIIQDHLLFGTFARSVNIFVKAFPDEFKNSSAYVVIHGNIFINIKKRYTPQEWAYIIAHLMLHLGLGHTNCYKVPKNTNLRLWNIACDIYITKFLREIKFKGAPEAAAMIDDLNCSTKSEMAIYEYLFEHENIAENFAALGTHVFGHNDIYQIEDILEEPRYSWSRTGDYYEKKFAEALQYSVMRVLRSAAVDDEDKDTRSKQAARWFINSYPLLGSLAAHFKVIENAQVCQQNDISVAAVNVSLREIYVNPAAGLSDEELKFVLAHEYLHAGLDHAGRTQGRDSYLWNVACDYVVNSWLKEMRVGQMPQNGLLYDETLKNMSAEEIYDILVRNIRTSKKLMTLRGYGKGDIIGKGEELGGSVSLDEFCRNALMQGLEYQLQAGRGFIPAGLIEEIRALAVPPIPWDVKLAKWFDDHFAPVEKHRTYARPSRRQASAPDIPRPRYMLDESLTDGRTFGVVIDTSGSMSPKDIGIALGAVASYAEAKDVPKVRVVFCDADAFDKGYMSPEEIAGRVEVIGRGGTILQPGIDLLERAKDFPKDGPILIITDGYIESDLIVKRDHAFLIPEGHRLPFKPEGKVFYYDK